MDPLTLEKLLSISDSIEDRRTGNIITDATYRTIIKQNFASTSKLLERRAKDVFRILDALSFLSKTDEDEIYIKPSFDDFISAWTMADIGQMNKCLSVYTPYNQFLKCLEVQHIFENFPRSKDTGAEEKFSQWLKLHFEQENPIFDTINFTIFESLLYWALPLGQAYLSPFDDALSWGGNWNTTSPSPEVFYDALMEAYKASKKASGYASLVQITDLICRKLHISFQAFEIKLNMILKLWGEDFVFASVTARHLASKSTISFVIPRMDVKRERLRATLLPKRRLGSIRWLATRFIEDGIKVNGRMVKLIKMEKRNDIKSRPKAISGR